MNRDKRKRYYEWKRRLHIFTVFSELIIQYIPCNSGQLAFPSSWFTSVALWQHRAAVHNEKPHWSQKHFRARWYYIVKWSLKAVLPDFKTWYNTTFLVQYIDYEMTNKINGPAAMFIRCLVYIRGELYFTSPFMLQVYFCSKWQLSHKFLFISGSKECLGCANQGGWTRQGM